MASGMASNMASGMASDKYELEACAHFPCTSIHPSIYPSIHPSIHSSTSHSFVRAVGLKEEPVGSLCARYIDKPWDAESKSWHTDNVTGRECLDHEAQTLLERYMYCRYL